MLPPPTSTPSAAYRRHGARIAAARIEPDATRPTPISITVRGPRRSISRPSSGLATAATRNPNENAPAVTPGAQPNSSTIGGKSSEKAVRALTPIPIVTKATPTTTQP